MLILSEYYWNSITENGEFVYEDENNQFIDEDQDGNPIAYTTATKHQPLQVEAPSQEDYFKELKWYLETQGAF